MPADQRKALEERFRGRLQALLAERFQLKIHRETKEMPVALLGVSWHPSRLGG